jgi:hypothetical protein
MKMGFYAGFLRFFSQPRKIGFFFGLLHAEGVEDGL